MSYEQESKEIMKWYKEENKKISDLMMANPVPGLDHPLQVDQARLHQKWLGKMADLEEKHGENRGFVKWRQHKESLYIKEKDELFSWYREERRRIAPEVEADPRDDLGTWAKTLEGIELYQKWLRRLQGLNQKYEVIIEYLTRETKK